MILKAQFIPAWIGGKAQLKAQWSNADAYLKLHNSTTVTVGTTAVAMCIKIPAGEGLSFDFGTLGARYATGICYSITGGVADTDTAAVAAGQVKVNLSYI